MSEITLVSNDNVSMKVPIEIAEMSATVKNLMEDLTGDDGIGSDETIPLPNVSGKILEKVIEYCKHHYELNKGKDPVDKETNDSETNDGETNDDCVNNAKRINDIDPWDKQFCEVDQATLFELILASNYLDIKSLLDLGCKSVANMIKNKSPEEIRQTFNIKNDFTPEEEEQIRKENEWCMEL